MDEQAIQKDLQARIDRDDPSVASEPNPGLPTEEGFGNADIGDQLDMYKLWDYFNIDLNGRDADNEAKLRYIYRWASSQVGGTDYLLVAEHLRQYENAFKLQYNEKGRFQALYELAKLDNQRKNIDREINLLHGTVL